MSNALRIFIAPDGEARFIYDDLLAGLISQDDGTTRRASHVEPTADGKGWTADLRPVGGPTLGPFSLRGEALQAERLWLEDQLRKGVAL